MGCRAQAQRSYAAFAAIACEGMPLSIRLVTVCEARPSTDSFVEEPDPPFVVRH
jgi:hypothetical protein